HRDQVLTPLVGDGGGRRLGPRVRQRDRRTGQHRAARILDVAAHGGGRRRLRERRRRRGDQDQQTREPGPPQSCDVTAIWPIRHLHAPPPPRRITDVPPER